MIFLKKEKKLTVDEMIQMEKELEQSILLKKGLSADEKNLSEILNLKVEYVDNMEDDNEAELLPINDNRYFGLIRLPKELNKTKFAYTHEIIHYIFDVGYGKRVNSKFARKKKGKTISREEQKTNYKTAAYIMPREEIWQALVEYDNKRPKMDELEFVSGLKRRYGQSELAVIRRIREVRRMARQGYCK